MCNTVCILISYICRCVYVCMCVYMYVYMCVCMYMYVWVCMYRYIYVYFFKKGKGEGGGNSVSTYHPELIEIPGGPLV